MDTKTILLDIGGTFIKCSDRRVIPINSDGSREEIASALRTAVGDARLAAVAIPGPFNYQRGVFLMKHKFAKVYGLSFAEIAGSHCSYHFTHDVNAMLLGEEENAWERGYSRIALVTLGTGLGFSMSINNQILKNELGSPLCSIFSIPFRDGILEDYASKRGFLRGYHDITVKELSDLARKGDIKARERFIEVGKIIAEAISPILDKYEIQCLKFGGQISRSFDLFSTHLDLIYRNVKSVQTIEPVSDIDNATFCGLKRLL